MYVRLGQRLSLCILLSRIYFIFLPFRKPKLPIEMAYQSHEEATALTEGSPTCSSEDITKRAAVMFELKERIYKRAIENIH